MRRAVTVNEGHRLAPERRGQVVLLLHQHRFIRRGQRSRGALDGIPQRTVGQSELNQLRRRHFPRRHRIFPRRERQRIIARAVAVMPFEEAEEFIKPAPHRMQWRQCAEVRFPNPRRRIAERLHAIAERAFRKRQAKDGIVFQQRPGIHFVAEPLLIAPRHQPRARRTADGTGDVAIEKAHAIRGERVEVRRVQVRRRRHTRAERGEMLRPHRPAIRPAEVVHEDDDDIRRRAGGQEQGGEGEKETAEARAHRHR